ncbi:MAG: 4Fe-4S binding protein [FCB group bacterium]|nr:4Fe-4S binding protein [FCB group bacterium]
MGKPEDLLTKNWDQIPRGGHVLEAGCANEYETGTWTTFKPVLDLDLCIQCLQCWVFCPDSAIEVEGEEITGFNLFHCKGCGICAEICPTKPEKAILMVKKDL